MITFEASLLIDIESNCKYFESGCNMTLFDDEKVENGVRVRGPAAP